MKLVGILFQRCRIAVGVGGNQMVGHQIAKKVKPEERELRQHPAFVRNAGGQHVIECRNPVGGHEQQTVRVQQIDITHLAAGVKLEFREVGVQENGV